MSIQQLDHKSFMRDAIAMATLNPSAPFGAVLVDLSTAKVVAKGVNCSKINPTWHGEIVAINDYASGGGKDWSQLVLYTTAEPCCMCQGAIVWAGISAVVYGVSIDQLLTLGWKQIEIGATEVAASSWREDLDIRGGVLANECYKLFQAASE